MSDGLGRPLLRLSSERGSLLLLWALTFSVTVMALIVGYFPMFHTTVATTNRTFRLEQAIALADTGIHRALWEIQTNNGAELLDPDNIASAWDDPLVFDLAACNETTTADGKTIDIAQGLTVTSCRTLDVTASVVAGDNFGGSVGTYTVWVLNYPGRLVRIVGLGTANGPSGSTETQAASVDLQSDSTFRYAAFGDKYLYSEGRVAYDSYNALLNGGCAYNTNCGGLTNRFENGDVGTNGRTNQVAPSWGYIRMGDSEPDIDGSAFMTPWSQAVYDGAANCLDCRPTSTVKQQELTMPAVQIPAEVSTYTNYGDAVVTTVQTCNEPRRYNTLQVSGAGGEFQIGPNCRLYIERPSGSPVATINTLNTDGGKFRLMTGRTTPLRLYIKNGGFDLDGPGFVNDLQKPEMLQIYVTGTNTSGAMAQTQPFHGVVYVQDPDGNASDAGKVTMFPGNQGGIVAHLEVYGAIIAGGHIQLWDQSYQNPTTYWVKMHYDESLADLLMDGTGTHRRKYTFTRGTWHRLIPHS